MLILSLTALGTGTYGAAVTANYYKFYSSLNTVTVNLSSLYWVADNRSLNGTVTFKLANPSDYSGLGLSFFKITWEVDGLSGKEKIPQGTPNLPLHMPRTLDPSRPITIDLQGGGEAPSRVTLIHDLRDIVINGTAPALGTNLSVDPKIKFLDSPLAPTPNSSGAWSPGKTITYDADNSGTYTIHGDVEFLFSIDLGLSSFLNSQATSIDSFDCISPGGPAACQLLGTAIIPVPTSGGGGGGGGD